MTREELREALSAAGSKFDGRVTHGSLEEQMKIIDEWLNQDPEPGVTAYFVTNWNTQPYPIIDHSLRIQQRTDGSFEFYIHPANQSGTTMDFIVEADGTVRRRREINGVLE